MQVGAVVMRPQTVRVERGRIVVSVAEGVAVGAECALVRIVRTY